MIKRKANLDTRPLLREKREWVVCDLMLKHEVEATSFSYLISISSVSVWDLSAI